MKLSGTILILVFSHPSFCQIDYGLKADINMSTTIFHHEPLPYKHGYDAGVIVDWTIKKKLFLSTQIEYSQKGNEELPGYLNLNYLTIPILFGYKVSTKFSILLGVESGVLLRASNEFPGLILSSTYQFKPIDFGINGSVRWLLFKNAGFCFSYVLSLDVIQRPIVIVPIYDTISNTVAGTYTLTTNYSDNFRNQAYQLGIYYFFR